MKENIWLMLLVGYMLVSILWSDIPYISFKRWTREVIAVVMAILVATERTPRQAMQSIFRRSAYVLIPFSILLIKYFTEYGVMYGRWSGLQMWTGVALHKNGLGRLCLISGIFLIWTLIRRWRGRDVPVTKYQTKVEVFILLLIVWLLKGPSNAYSATSVATLVVGLAVLVGLLWKKKLQINLRSNTLAIIMVFIISYGIVTFLVSGSNISFFASILGRDDTLTGRTDIWAELLPVAMQNPILGHGFGGFWTPLIKEKFKISESHNGYLEILLELGYFGILIFVAFLLSCCRKATKELNHDYDWACLWICFLLVAALHNVAESSLNSFGSYLTAVLIFLSVSCTVPNSFTQEVS